MSIIKQAQKSYSDIPSFPQFVLFFLLLGWLAITPIIIAGLMLLLPTAWPSLVNNLLAVFCLSIFLFLPVLGFLGLIQGQQWQAMRPFGLILLLLVIFITLSAGIRAVTEPVSNLETFLRLIGLTFIVLLSGGLAMSKLGLPDHMLAQAFGLVRPSPTALWLSLILIPIVTIGWPLTGALGDRWTAQLLLLQTLGQTLPEELLFRGALPGILLYHLPERKRLAALLATVAYLAFTPSGLIPYHDWGYLFAPLILLPLTLILIELRLLTGSIWSGLLLAWAYQATPFLFTDPRVELPLITQPWQTAAYLWMMVSASGLVLMLWLGYRYISFLWALSRLTRMALALVAVLCCWGLWAGLWFAAGYPGFYNDGFLIIMTEQADLGGAEAVEDIVERKKFVRARLIETAEQTQAPIRAALEAAGLTYRPFYLINMIRVEGNHRRMAEFAGLPGVARVMLNPNVRPYPFNFSFGYGDTPDQAQGVEWNISQVGADAVWKMGFTGQGIVVAGQDTGYAWDHPALRQSYRGHKGEQASHAYNWHDAWSNAVVPFDSDQHGTHTMGTIVGDDGQGNQIGMAPGASWIGCRNMQRGLGNPASYTDCMEFFLAPYPPGGDPFRDGDVSQAPHVINNSWGCPDIEGCDDTVLEPATAALRAAGIMMVASAGNSGPGCQTVSEPPARYDQVFSVGATNSLSQITSFSSRGPVPDSAALLKPDITAPGSNIRSSLPGGGYGTAEGTSMASPHVAGLVALIWSANPALIGRVDETETIIRQSARKQEVEATCTLETEADQAPSLLEEAETSAASDACACGDIVGVPNNVYGWGEIDAVAAVKLALEYQPKR